MLPLGDAVETSEHFVPLSSIHLGETFSAGETTLLVPAGKTCSVMLWKTDDVVFDTGWALLLGPGGDPLDFSRYLVNEKMYRAVGLHRQIDESFANDDVAIGFNKAFTNHFHWTTQCLTAIMSYRDPALARLKILIPRGITEDQRISLRLMGVDPGQLLSVDARRQYRIRSSFFSSFLTGKSSFFPSRRAAGMYQEMASRAGRSPLGKMPVIYFTRTNTNNRPMRNERELEESLTRRGVKRIDCMKYSYEEQVAIARDAQIVIGPHGAALTNIAFCRSGAIVYELFPEHYINPCTAVLAQVLGIEYFADRFEAFDHDVLPRHDVSWEVDIPLVNRRLDEILAKTSLVSL